MQHIDEETLAMIALGETSNSSAEAHLLLCDQCLADTALLRRAISGLRNTDALSDPSFPVPPAQLWKDIARNVGIAVAIDASQPQASGSPKAEDPRPPRSGTRLQQVPDTGHAVQPAAPVVSHDRLAVAPVSDQSRTRRFLRSRRTIAACATAIGAALGTGATWWATSTHDSHQQQASHQLQPILPATAGYASLSSTHGQRILDITVQGLPKTAGYFEVWLMDSSHTKLISLGTLAPNGHALLPVPDNVSLSEYSIVDVSIQAYNGSPAHSGKSIVRGQYRS